MPKKASGKEPNGGVHIQAGGGLRISNLSLFIDRAAGELTTSDIQTEVRTDIFQHWLQIAEDAIHEAETARAVARDAREDDSEEFGGALQREFRASLIAIGSAAFAVDGFYASAVHQAPQISVKCKARDATIYETLKRGFLLTTEQQRALRKPLRDLFRLRDGAVHPRAAWAAPLLHPDFNVGMDPKFVHYRVGNAADATLLVRQLIWTCVTNPKSEYQQLVEWSHGRAKELPKPPLPDGWIKPSSPPDKT